VFGKRELVGRVLIDIDLDSAVFEVHVHKVGILKAGQESVVAVKFILVDGGSRGESQYTSCDRHGDEECTEESLGQHLWFVDALSCDTVIQFVLALI
jgi:hypothetical protein